MRKQRRRTSSTRSPSGSAHTLDVGGRKVGVSRLEKVFYPSTGFTKGQVIDYYIRVSPVLLPHLKDRPLTLKRYPDGVDGGFFYEKRCPSYRPDWIRTAPVWSERHDAEIHYCVANDLPSIVWAANLGDLELHTFLARAKNVQRPTMVVFDLDPGPPANIVQCAEVALWLRERLAGMKLNCFAKTSGSKGLQLYVPLNTPVTYEQTKSFARALAEELQTAQPERVVARMEKRLRAGKVFVDWSQNDRHKTTVCVYSLRAKERPTVSTPVTWEEVEAALKRKDPERLVFLSDDVLKRVERKGDLFAPVLKLKQKLP
ncbi:MAG TPA: ATP-dependent DNA ligase [Verrucomicrobia bacterium]|nr:ATP-dependent DNA ligase [Verrucomicrobiota bacterium]HOP98002.1 non-homologous end-joining DNA ligase [Verrucomicrobiota bacterium]HPU54912.1 non-homologous end-joining DNA ligase [Verrucomicrobiota bacterium]